MIGFDSKLQLQDEGLDPDTGVHRFSTLSTLTFRYGFNGGELAIRVPVGTLTDFASIPWCLQWLCPKMGPWNRAAVLHDYLCGLEGCSRFLADAIFREAMCVLRVPVWRRVSMYYAVRFFAVVVGIK